MRATGKELPIAALDGLMMRKEVVSKAFSALAILCSLFSNTVSADEPLAYLAPMERSQWYISTSIFECSVVHDIPIYGQGIFYHEAGEDIYFYTQAASSAMKAGKAALVIEASPWRPGGVVRDLGLVDVTETKKPLRVERARAHDMMKGLLEGMMPTFTRKAWFSDASVRVSLNSIGFSSTYDEYLECISSLLPVNFRQVERSSVNFESDKAVLLRSDIKTLDMVIMYVKADPSVTAVYVDGHTDATGRRIYNRRLSKARAEAVTQYLTRQGINPDTIQTRYHGERYPIAGNVKSNEKAKNRRTTVRLVRGTSLSMPTKESPEGELN